eukprot:TRINITY_DN1482_c0_g1_i5.p1 TRINITY_DN1482_c0_g1~~TRINITY_DN1482_c0_g1_i5.p1  ORF type:complete len:217 (-),score=48.25 TRINITY_DN1482_c0_g1_i5:336-986(-)
MGETCLQYYNTCLSLPKIQENVDGVLMYENDKVASILGKHPKAALSQLFTMEHINEYIGLGVQQVLAPTQEGMFDFSALMDLVCCPMFKFLQCDMWPFTYEHKCVSSAEEQWSDVCDKCASNIQASTKPQLKGISALHHAAAADSIIKHKSIALRVQLKSSFANKELYVNHGTLNPHIREKIDAPCKMVDWNPDGLYVKTYNTKPFSSLLVSPTTM